MTYNHQEISAGFQSDIIPQSRTIYHMGNIEVFYDIVTSIDIQK